MKVKKRIICTVTNDLSYDQRMQRICTTLATQNYEVTLVGRNLPQSKALKPYKFKQQRLNCFFKKGKFFYLEYNIRLFCFLFFAKTDLICSVDLDTILAGSWVSFLRGKKHVYDAHEYFTELPEVVERPQIQAIWAWVANRTISKVDGAYTVCQSLAQIFQKNYGKHFDVIRNVPFSYSMPIIHNKPTQPYILLYQGALNDGRGLEELLEAMQSFKATEIQLWIVGEGDLSDELRQLAQHLDVEDRVRFWGYVLPEDLKKITLQAHIGLNLLINKGLNYYYSLANKFFDYTQAEKPSINMAFPEYLYHQKEYEVSLLLKELSAAAIVNCLCQLFKEEKLYEKLQKNCQAAKKAWNWEIEQKKVIDFYAKLLEN